MPRGELSTEADEVARTHTEIETFFKYEELPLVSTGCDSYASWHPDFKDLSPMMESNGIVHRIMEILPHKRWEQEHLVITGGEPLLGWQRAYPDLLDHPSMSRLKEITFETNGTQPLTDEFKSYLHKWKKSSADREITFSVSAKLPCSGEAWGEATNRCTYAYLSLDCMVVHYFLDIFVHRRCSIRNWVRYSITHTIKYRLLYTRTYMVKN
jgi:hypothetical protein